MDFKERKSVKLNINEKFPSEILGMIDQKPFFNLTIDSDFGQQWNLANLTVADVYMFGNSYCKQASDPKISKAMDQFYDTLVRLNPELANIKVENVDRKLDVIRGVGSGLHFNDIKYFVENLKGTAANQNEQDFELNEQAYDIYQKKHGEDADHKIGYALSPETAQRVIENIPYPKKIV